VWTEVAVVVDMVGFLPAGVGGRASLGGEK
jgi:hypothetical protein